MSKMRMIGRSIDLVGDFFHGAGVFVRALFITFLGGVVSLQGETSEDLTLGIETVTGLRTSYIYRGYQLAESTLEVQLETELALGRDFYLGLAAWHVAESGASFSETAFGLGLSRDWEGVRLTASIDYHIFDHQLFESGLDFGLQGQWFIDDNWELSLAGHYDVAAEGAYFAMEGGWSYPFTESLYLAVESGVSATADYYGESGLNDVYGRISLTYNINSFLSLSPFAGYSIALRDQSSDEAYAGIWLAVAF